MRCVRSGADANHERGVHRNAVPADRLQDRHSRTTIGEFDDVPHIKTELIAQRRATLFVLCTAMALAPLFPLVPGFGALLLLQLVNGAAVSFAWSGA
jgi:hypothetical protein